MGFIIKGLKVIIGLIVFLVVIGAIFGNHNTSTPAATTTDTKTAYTRDNVNFISKDRVDENIKLGVANAGDYKEVQVPLNTVVVGGYSTEDLTTSKQQTQPPANRQTEQENSQASGWTAQTYSTGFGKVQISIPYVLYPDPSMSNTDNTLMLGLHVTPDPSFPKIDWMNVIWIMKLDLMMVPYSMDKTNRTYETLTTDDGHTMSFNSERQENGEYNYYAYIDYSKDKNFFILIDGNSERYWFKPITTFTEAEFKSVCKSFKFVQ